MSGLIRVYYYHYLGSRGKVEEPLGVTIRRVAVIFAINDHQRGADLMFGVKISEIGVYSEAFRFRVQSFGFRLRFTVQK